MTLIEKAEHSLMILKKLGGTVTLVGEEIVFDMGDHLPEPTRYVRHEYEARFGEMVVHGTTEAGAAYALMDCVSRSFIR